MQQGLDGAFATVFAALGQHGFGLFGCGRLNVPAQHAAVKRFKNLAAAGAGAQQKNDADVGARKVLHQPRQQLHFMVGQRAGVMNNHNAGNRLDARHLHGLLHRLAGQHLVEAGQHGGSVGREIDFQLSGR